MHRFLLPTYEYNGHINTQHTHSNSITPGISHTQQLYYTRDILQLLADSSQFVADFTVQSQYNHSTYKVSHMLTGTYYLHV